MKKLAIVLIILGVLLAILVVVGWYVDRTARQMAETEASKRILEVLPGTGKAVVKIDSFPFLLGVLWSGSVDRLEVELTDVKQAGLEVEKIDLVIDELRIDKDLLMDEKKLAVTGIDRAEVVGRISGEAVSQVIGEQVVFDGKTAKVAVHGMKVDATFVVKKRKVTVSLSAKDVPPEIAAKYLSGPLVFELPGEQVLPCEPGLAVVDSRLELRCSVTELPPSVKQALGQR
jgi:hypothetical protein